MLAGTGPGDPSLVTVAALEYLRAADVVVYDSLVSSALLREAPQEAEMIHAGKQAGGPSAEQGEINAVLIDRANQGALVVRLKGGDPYIFGRGAEEASALAEAGVRFAIVPGITAATAASLYAGIPLTDRRFSPSLTFVSGHSAADGSRTDVDWKALADLGGTVVFYMGIRSMPEITQRLVEAGRDPATPAAVVENAGSSCQRTVTGTLADIAARSSEAGVGSPGLLIIGEVVTLYPELAWYEQLPLFGKRVAVTRAAERAESMSARLRALGADVVEIPTIQIRKLPVAGEQLEWLRNLDRYDDLILTSAAAVDIFFELLKSVGRDARALAGLRLAAIGAATARHLDAYGIRPDLCPADFVAESLLADLAAQDMQGRRVLLPRSGKARAVVVERLEELGAVVDELKIYEPTPAETSYEEIRTVLDTPPDFITFTSSSTVENFIRILGEDDFTKRKQEIRAASIGPVTSKTLRRHGIEPIVESERHTAGGLIDAMEAWAIADAED